VRVPLLPRALRQIPLLVAVVSCLVLAMVAPAAAMPQPLDGPSAAALPAALPLAGVVVAIDPGHQLGNASHPSQINRPVWVGFWKSCNTTGTATSSGFPEATFTWRVARALRARLTALGATVRLTRTSNSRHTWGPCVDDRGRFGARVHADVEISLHGDGAASSQHGFFVIQPGLRRGYTGDIRTSSHRFATAVHAGLLAAGFQRSTSHGGDGYDVRRDLGTLNMADVPTVMVELGNMRNASDARCMTSPSCRGRYADGLASGIRHYLVR
jgi:N-acetylmuramoyl-L-alanine amidase